MIDQIVVKIRDLISNQRFNLRDLISKKNFIKLLKSFVSGPIIPWQRSALSKYSCTVIYKAH